MPRPPARGPTARELSILHVLWALGPSTVREVHRALRDELKLAYNTVLSMLQVMTEKGLVRRDETRYPQHYEAVLAREPTQEAMTRDFIDQVFGGSALQLVQRALAAKPASEAEMAQLEAFLKVQREGGGRDGHDL